MGVADTRGRIERGALVALVGVAVLTVLGITLTTIYVDRIGAAASGLKQIQPVADYVGRPVPATGPNGSSAVNFLIMVTDSGALDAVVVANLSASRSRLTLISLPSDLLVASEPDRTLAATFATDPVITSRAVEALTGARMDHQLLIDLDGLASVVDSVGGVNLDHRTLDGADAVAEVGAASEPSSAAAALIRAVLVSAGDSTPLDPVADRLMAASAPWVEVDAGLTSAVVENMVMESSVRAEETALWPLATTFTPDGALARPEARAALSAALAQPDLAVTPEYQRAAFIPVTEKR